jgi:RNA polymerase-binding transcription factor DksA
MNRRHAASRVTEGSRENACEQDSPESISSRVRACKELLEAHRIRLLHRLEEDPGRTTASAVAPEPGDNSIESRVRSSRLLWIVECALQAIADGAYANCLFCQKKIPLDRLAAVPWSAYCASCQELAEAYVNSPLKPPQSSK